MGFMNQTIAPCDKFACIIHMRLAGIGRRVTTFETIITANQRFIAEHYFDRPNKRVLPANTHIPPTLETINCNIDPPAHM